jgi:hypothetical protein
VGKPIDVDVVRTELPGAWQLSATNFPLWLDGGRRDPSFDYELRSAQPLRFADRVSFIDGRDRAKTIAGADHWRGDHFVWRGAGLLGVLTSRWTISWLADDVLVTHFEKSRMTPAGADVSIRSGSEHPELRRRIARDPEAFGLTVEEFASLTWLDHIPAL